jgi:hypothetical protein
LKYLKNTKASTPEKKATLEKKYSMTPNSQKRLLNQKVKTTKSTRKRFSEKGGGHKVDDWWLKVKPHLLARFKEQQKADAMYFAAIFLHSFMRYAHKRVSMLMK